MKVVDPEKLSPHREMIDTDVAALSLSQDLTLPNATFKYALDELGQRLLVRGAWSHWWSCLPIRATAFRANRPRRHEMSTKVILEQAKLVARFVSTNTVVARTPDAAATAAICHIIDPTVDIFMSDDRFEALYGRNAVDEIITCLPLQMSPNELDDNRNLFETEEEYFDRLFEITTHYYTLTEARRSFEFMHEGD